MIAPTMTRAELRRDVRLYGQKLVQTEELQDRIVSHSDFLCGPYALSSLTTLSELVEEYEGKVEFLLMKLNRKEYADA